MKSLSRILDTLLLYAVSWLGGPIRGLPDVEVDCLPGYRPSRPSRRMRFAI